MMNQGLRAVFKNFHAHPAILSQDGKTVTFGRLGALVTSFADRLVAAGVQPGQRVAPLVDNTVVRLALFMATWRIGADLVLTDDPARPIARGIAIDHVVAAAHQPVTHGPQWHVFDQSWMDVTDGGGPDDVPGAVTIFGTSGSTGLPKYMSQTTDHWYGLVKQYADQSMDGQNAFLVGYPPATTAFVLVALMSFEVGKGISLPCGSVEETLAAAKDFGVTGLHGPPSVLSDVVTAAEQGAACPTFTYIRPSGGATGPALLHRLYRQFDCPVTVLGAANETQVFSMGVYAGQEVAPGWAGNMLPHVVYELRDKDRYAQFGDTAGRLAIKVPAQLQVNGYIGGASIYDLDGWAETGDIVTVDAAGVVHFVGRDDFLINIGGGKFAPEQIEVAVEKMPGVRKVGAAPIRTDEGDLLALAIVGDDSADTDAISGMVGKMIVQADALRLIEVDQLPVLPSGKIDREAIALDAINAS